MDADLDLLLTAVYVTADDLLPCKPGNARRSVTDAEVVTLCVAQAMMGIPSDRRFSAVASKHLRYLLAVLNDLHQRGVGDGLIVCVDGLAGFPEAIAAVFPQAWVQTCIVHMIRASMRYVSYADRKRLMPDLRRVCSAPNIEEAATARCSRRSTSASRSQGGSSGGSSTPPTGSATIAGGSAISGRSSATTRTGTSHTASSAFCGRSTGRMPSAGSSARKRARWTGVG